MTADLDATLAAMDGVPGAAAIRRAALKLPQAAAALCDVNPRRRCKDLDAMLRAVHQFGLTRRQSCELLLRVHGAEPGPSKSALASRARTAYRGTVRGALMHDVLTNAAHWFLPAALALLAALMVALLVCKYYPNQATLQSTPLVCAYLAAMKPFVWTGGKFAVLGVALAALWSARALALAGARLASKRAKARFARAVPFARLGSAASLVAAGVAAGVHAPYMYVAGCCGAAYVLERWRAPERAAR